MQATLTFLGTGTSMGIPTLGCPCAVCASAVSPTGDPHNRRTRPSVRVEWRGHTVLIDTGPDFHAQAIRENIRRVDAVLYTHGHADHILGMDDLRPLSFLLPGGLPLFADDDTAGTLERIFSYVFDPAKRHSTTARVNIHRIEHGTEIDLFGASFLPVPLIHGRQRTTGYRFGTAAYLTDMNDLPPESVPLLQGLDILILDALRITPHFSHSHLEKSIAFVDLLQPKRALFTHMGHDLDHEATNAALPPHIRLAYDGQQLDFEITPEITA
jgi:phosphoribosyl 1,2-cyclic phosphate phosphodiesterase